MTWLFERPLLIAIFAVMLVAVFVAALVKTGQWRFVYLAVASLLVGIGLLAVERAVVTPFEQVKTTLDEIAADFQQNDVEAIVSHISDVAPKLQQEARNKLRQVQIFEVRIKSNLGVTFADARGREVAQARFNAVIELNDKAGQYRRQPHPRFVIVNFRKEGEAWKIISYEIDDPLKGMGS